MIRIFLLYFLCVYSLGGTQAASKIKVACVGNSVTYGYLLADREKYAYPAQLSRMLGDGYEVRNFGKSGATLLKKGHRPYMKQPEFREALDFAPDWVIIHLGLNDTDPRNWPNYRDEFIPDYLALIDSFRTVRPGCKIWICRMTPIFHWHPRFKSGTRDWYWQEQAAIEKIARIAHTGLIDLHEGLYHRPDLMPDALHPNAEGAGILAKAVYSGITGNYGGLRLPAVYGDGMVLQRGPSLTIRGVANAGDKVTVRLGKQKAGGQTGADGRWQVVLKDLKAGGPYELTVKSADQELRFQNVMIGDVWLCSGQSNMAFMVKQAANAARLLEQVPAHPGIRLFDMKPKVFTDAVSWDSAALVALNRLDYYADARWTLPDAKSVADFSAVAYCFGRLLADSLQVPVGLICNAVGGAPAEAFIDRKSLEFNDRLVDILYNWTKNDMIQDWVRGRAALNMKNSPVRNQRHPYEPCYLFETGILPLADFPIKGVIWYQGESNAHNVELHEAIFPVLVQSWRKVWGERLPFYYTQLSSLNRPSWPHFRDSQRAMLEKIPYSGMAVTSDKGNPTDVHPREKQAVGERLASWALHDTYQRENVVSSGPLFRQATFRQGAAYVDFSNAEEMKSSDGKPLRTFEIAGEDGLFVPASATVEGKQVKVWSDRVKNPRLVRYGWQPYTDANLINGAGLPASTFKSIEEKR